ncbi:uncharacterized protein C1683.06c [Eurytemora carolleeae]|uniref:uncharacterized protein C1683.06c n=1 Tax=Eurytemora carolleeae TaxID=1294199 RepID=UPI000C780985|nr:uncharacterized protein C1683.06c [Eurytemora carolleeae]|eukprot:XP_023319735.1 uncharacterized protein C1683.06c-like [Eurytemora affinis]
MEFEKDLYIVDTDTGVDDAIALLQAVAAKKKNQIELLCITAVNGNCSCEDAVRNICRVLDTVNVHDVPLYRGATQPLVVPYTHEKPYHGEDGFNDVKFDTEPDMSRVKDEHAWNMISELSKQYPNRITLVAIGPLTNIALAMKLDPGLPTRLKEIFIMGGNTEGIGNVTASAEFNFCADPEAASIVLQLTSCPTYIAGWELCFKYTKLTRQWRDQVLGTIDKPAAVLAQQLEMVWFNDYPWGDHWIICDQLAMTAALNRSSIKKSSPYNAQVVIGDSLARGMMVLDQRVLRYKANNVIVIEELDEEVVKEQMLIAFNQ